MVLLLDLAILSEIILARPPITECSSIVKTCLKLLVYFIFSLRGFKVCIFISSTLIFFSLNISAIID